MAFPLVTSAAPGDVVINEIMQNPSAVPDSAGEWFELYNATGSAIDINGWTIQDNDFDSHVISNGGPLLVPAGGYLVLGNNGDSGSNGGVSVGYVYGSSWFLANGADEVVLLDNFLTEIDRVEYDGGPAYPDPNGASMALRSPSLDNNVGANWCESPTTFGAGDRGTPGAANDCPAPEVVINEIMQNPSAVADSAGEWFELHNPGASPVDIDGWTIEDNDFDSHVINNGGPLLVPAGGYLVLGNNANSATNGGVTVAYQYSGLFLANGGDEVVLLDASTNEIDRVEYDGGPVFPDPNGASMALVDPALDNNDGANWCTSSTPFGAGDLGTPGAANGCPVSVPELVINEIMQNPSAVSDTNGEWFEVFNPTSDPIDIDGWTIQDNDFDSHVISNGGPLVVPAGGYAVLARNADSGANGGVTVDYQYSGVFLGNSSDELVLLDGLLSEVDRVEWDNGATFPDPNGASMSLLSPALDNNVGANWCTASTPFGDGDLGTPGAANDCPPPPILINEVDADTPGSDTLEFVELYDGGAGNTPLDGLVVVFFNGNGDVAYDAFDLDGFSTDADGYFVLGNAAVSPAPDIVFGNNGLQNGADAVALYIGDGSSFPDGTPVTTDELLDALVYDTFDADDAGLLVLLNAGQPQVNEGGAGDKDNHSNQRCPDGFGGGRNTDGYEQDVPTPGALNNCSPLEIFQIQGAGPASPYDGFIVGTAENVVTSLASNGFFMQTPAARDDLDVDTSNGIFVFTGGAPAVAVGDLVDVTGLVDEFFGLTEFTAGPSVTVTGSGAVPAPVQLNEFVPSPDPDFPSCAIEYECYEGMHVEVADGYVAGANQEFGSDPFAEIHISAAGERAFREPGIEYPGILGFPIWDGNPEVFELDPDRLGLPNQNIPAGSTFTAKGVMGFEFDHYELWPYELVVAPAPLPVAVRAAESSEMTIGSLNLFRLFDDVDDPPSLNSVGAVRDDSVVSTAEYLRRRAKLAAHIVGVLGSPDILAVQEAEKIEVLQALAADINALDPAVVYTAYLIEGNDVGTIDVGFLVRDRVQVSAVTQLGADELFTFDDPDSALHDRPPLLLEGTCDGTFPIAVMVLHQRSLGGIETERVQRKRFEQAESVAQKVQAIQSADPEVNLVVLGDFNAFEFTDGYVDAAGIIKGDFAPADSLVCSLAGVTCVDLVEPDLTDEVLEIDAGQRYSFIFRDTFNPVRSRGDSQVLDHAMTSSALDTLVTGFEYGRGNADAAEELLERDGTEPDAGPDDLLLRASDHDGLVLFVLKDEDLDGVPDEDDVCLGTEIPEGVPTVGLGVNRFALTDDDLLFDTTPPAGRGPGRSYTVSDTGGCSCEQIIEALGLGQGHVKYGCSIGVMDTWVSLVNP